jgi:rubrerythrin
MLYKVLVTVTAQIEYEVMVDSASESDAEDEAVARYRRELPDDFQVEKGYITNFETEAEQLSWECYECGVTVTRETYSQNDEMCSVCFALAAA